MTRNFEVCGRYLLLRRINYYYHTYLCRLPSPPFLEWLTRLLALRHMIYNSHALMYHISVYIYIYMYYIIIYYYIVWCTLLLCITHLLLRLLLGSTRRRATWRRRSAAKNKDKRKENITTRRSDALKPSREIVSKTVTRFPSVFSSVRLLSRYRICSNIVITYNRRMKIAVARSAPRFRIYCCCYYIIWRFNDDGLVVARVTYLYLRVKKKKKKKTVQ